VSCAESIKKYFIRPLPHHQQPGIPSIPNHFTFLSLGLEAAEFLEKEVQQLLGIQDSCCWVGHDLLNDTGLQD